MKRGKLLLLAFICTMALASCYKKDIQFATNLGETYTNLVQVDTVSVEMSTVLLDSFKTTAPSYFLLGRYQDEVFGIVNAKPFFELGPPSDITVATTDIYDSLEFIIKNNHYYYGDTTKSLTFTVNELAENLDYSYSDQFYNSTKFAIKANPLGSKTMTLRPVSDTIIKIRLNDARGLELFNKLKNKSDDVKSADAFNDYIKGISLGVGDNDNSVIYGLKVSADDIVMRLHYHNSIPYEKEQYKDFPFLSNNMYFNQVITDRSNTLLQGHDLKLTEIPATQTNNQAFMQTSTGTLLKVSFPSLRDVLKISSNVKLQKATLVLRVADGTFNSSTRILPDSIYLSQTNGSNAIGSSIANATGTGTLYGTRSIGFIYNSEATYTFDLTSSVKYMMETPGTDDYGFFLMEDTPAKGAKMNRAIFNAARNGDASSKLILTVLTVKD